MTTACRLTSATLATATLAVALLLQWTEVQAAPAAQQVHQLPTVVVSVKRIAAAAPVVEQLPTVFVTVKRSSARPTVLAQKSPRAAPTGLPG
jgi:hypothetical protein